MDTPEITEDGTFILKKPIKLPEVLDILVVGAGPGGSAAAFRAKELGLAVLTIELDDKLTTVIIY